MDGTAVDAEQNDTCHGAASVLRGKRADAARIDPEVRHLSVPQRRADAVRGLRTVGWNRAIRACSRDRYSGKPSSAAAAEPAKRPAARRARAWGPRHMW